MTPLEFGGKPCVTLKGEKRTGDDGNDDEYEKRSCDSPQCPRTADAPYWSTWKDWETCEKAPETPCYKSDSGTRKRKRDCQIGNDGRSAQTLDLEKCNKIHHGKTSMQEAKCLPPCGSYSELYLF